MDKNYRCPTKCVSTGIPNTCNIPNEPASHGRCVTAHQLNNGVNNCADGSDEGILIPTFFYLLVTDIEINNLTFYEIFKFVSDMDITLMPPDLPTMALKAYTQTIH